MTNKTVLVTGGLGYIGSHTVVLLLEQGFDVVVVDDLSNSKEFIAQRIEEITGKTIQLYISDIKDLEAVKKIFEAHQLSGIMHFAAYKAVGESMKVPMRYYNNNLIGLLNLLEAMKIHQVDNFIFSSSCTVYGQAEKLPVDESAPFLPASSVYGRTKQMGEDILADFARAENKKVISLRYFNPIGAHPSARIGELPLGVPDNLVPYVTQTAVGIREKLSVFGSDYPTRDGTAIRDYIYVMDLAEAHVLALKKLLNDATVSNQNPQIYNLGTGTGSTVLEVIQAFSQATNIEIPYQFAEKRAGDVIAAYADNQKAKKELDWQASTSLQFSLKTAWEWEKAYREEFAHQD